MGRLPGENKKKIFLFFSNYLPLQIWTLKICNHSRYSFKLGEHMMSRLPGENLKTIILFFCMQIWTLKICKICEISKTIIARSFKLW